MIEIRLCVPMYYTRRMHSIVGRADLSFAPAEAVAISSKWSYPIVGPASMLQTKRAEDGGLDLVRRRQGRASANSAEETCVACTEKHEEWKRSKRIRIAADMMSSPQEAAMFAATNRNIRHI